MEVSVVLVAGGHAWCAQSSTPYTTAKCSFSLSPKDQITLILEGLAQFLSTTHQFDDQYRDCATISSQIQTPACERA